MPIAATNNGIQVEDPGNGFYQDFLRQANSDRIVKPNPGKQEDFVTLPDSIFEALFGGAAYGGKSWILTLLPLFRGFYKFRGFKGIILRRKFPDLEREIIRLSKEYYPATGAKYNETKHSWEWPEYGSYMDFGHVQHNTDISMYDSAQYNYCAFDELTHFDAYPYHYMVGSRVRPGSAFNIAIVRNGTNPGGPGQTFVYNRFVKPNENGYVVLRDKNTGLTRIFIPALAEDNPHGMEYDPLYVKKLEILATVSEAEYKAKRYGDWHAFKGSVFTTFRPMHFPGEPDNALHVIDGFEIPAWWPRILCIDWGKHAMCYALWGAISPDKRLYLYRERAWHGKDIAHWASEIRELHDELNEVPDSTVLCGSAWQNRGAGTIAADFQRYSGLTPASSENTPGSRVATLQLVHDFLRWERKTTLKTKEQFYDMRVAQEIYRKYGPEVLEQYKKQFFDEPDETNLPVLQIFSSLKTLIDTIPVCVYDEKRTEDIAEFEGDDPIDDLRYMCKTARRYLLGEIGNMEHQQKIAEIEQELQMTQDMTKYYRQMEHLEAQNRYNATNCVAVSRRSRFARRRH